CFLVVIVIWSNCNFITWVKGRFSSMNTCANKHFVSIFFIILRDFSSYLLNLLQMVLICSLLICMFSGVIMSVLNITSFIFIIFDEYFGWRTINASHLKWLIR